MSVCRSDFKLSQEPSKLGASRVDEGAKTLLKLADRVDTDRCGKPAALGVIVGSWYGYARPDGVGVIPVRGLGV